MEAEARRVKASLESLRQVSESNARQCQRSSEVFRERIAGAEDCAQQLALATKDRRERLLELQRLCRSLQGETASEVALTRERHRCLVGDLPCVPPIQASEANVAGSLQAGEQGASNVPVVGGEQELSEPTQPLPEEASAANSLAALQPEKQGAAGPTTAPVMVGEHGAMALAEPAQEEVKVQAPTPSAEEVEEGRKHNPGAELREGAGEKRKASDEIDATHQDEAATKGGILASSSAQGKKEAPQHEKARGKVAAKGKKEPQQDKEAAASLKKPREEKEATPQEKNTGGAKSGAKGKKESAQDKARRLAEEKAKKLADEKAKKQADERSRKEAEKRAKQEVEERAKHEAEQARQEVAEEKEKANQEVEKEKATVEVEEERDRHEEAMHSRKATEEELAGHGKFEELLEAEEFEEPETPPQPHEQLRRQEADEEDFGDAREGEEVNAAGTEPTAQERGWFSWIRGR